MTLIPEVTGAGAVASLTSDDIHTLAGDGITVQVLDNGIRVDTSPTKGETLGGDFEDDTTRPLLVHDQRIYSLTLYVPGYALPVLLHRLPIGTSAYPRILTAACEGDLARLHATVNELVGTDKHWAQVAQERVKRLRTREPREGQWQVTGTEDHPGAIPNVAVLVDDGVPYYREQYPGHLSDTVISAWYTGGLAQLWPVLMQLEDEGLPLVSDLGNKDGGTSDAPGDQ